jgi:hypothetical protein
VRHRDLDAVDPAAVGVAAAAAYPATISPISVRVSARGSEWKRGLGTAEGATAGGRGAPPNCSRPPWKSWTKSFVPWGRTAPTTRS